MCIYVMTSRHVATEDIICYKKVNYVPSASKTFKDVYKEGDEFSGVIKNLKVKGKVHYENNSVYFCTNEESLNGTTCEDKLGYEYSWIYDDEVSYLDKIDLSKRLLESYVTCVQHMPIEIGETYTSKLEEPDNNDRIEIGLHAFTKKTRVYLTPNVQCTIPKGSEYYLGYVNEIVTNCLKYEKLL